MSGIKEEGSILISVFSVMEFQMIVDIAKSIQGLLNRWTSQLGLGCTTGGLERVVSAHNST